MFIIYIKQTLYLIRENKLLSSIFIAGTAFAIALIMVIVLTHEVKNADYTPEVNRSRTLYCNSLLEDNNRLRNNSLWMVENCYYKVESAETVSAAATFNEATYMTPSKSDKLLGYYTASDAAFFTVFRFRFLAGTHFSQDEFLRGDKKAVITDRLARFFFLSPTDAIGKTIRIDFQDYTVCGVVAEVSRFAENAYADAWIPYKSNARLNKPNDTYPLGPFRCYLLARSPSNFPAIKNEVINRVAQINRTLKTNGQIALMGQPDTQLEASFRVDGREMVDVAGNIRKYVLLILLLLFIPAINLSGLTVSRMQKRVAEIGIRKTFGATRWEIIKQVIYENLLLTLLGGIVGMALSYALLQTMGTWLFSSTSLIYKPGNEFFTYDMLLRPDLFAYAFGYCLLINMLSSTLPAWIASRKNIINALNFKK